MTFCINEVHNIFKFPTFKVFYSEVPNKLKLIISKTRRVLKKIVSKLAIAEKIVNKKLKNKQTNKCINVILYWKKHFLPDWDTKKSTPHTQLGILFQLGCVK